MGIASYLKNKAKETITNAQAERAYNKAEKLEERNEFDRGRREAAYRQGAGLGSTHRNVEYDKKGRMTKSSETVSYNKFQQSQPQMRGGSGKGRGASWSPDWGAGSAMFGSGGGSGGFDIFGGGGERRATPPMRTRTISPSGKVTIQEPIQQKPMNHSDGIGELWGTPGVAGAVRKKGERDPYDFIL